MFSASLRRGGLRPDGPLIRTHYIAAGTFPSRQGTYEVEVKEILPEIEYPDSVREGVTGIGDITALQGLRFLGSLIDGDDDRIDYYCFTQTDAKQVGIGLRR